MNKTNSIENFSNKLKKLCNSGGVWVRSRGGSYKKPCQKGDELYFDPYFPTSQDHPVYYEKVFHQVRDPLNDIKFLNIVDTLNSGRWPVVLLQV